MTGSRTPRLRRGAVSAAALVAALLVPACIVSGGQPHPLYPDPEHSRPPGEVARLFGPIGTVDGQDVARLGKSFALLPGCHVVMLAEKTGEINNMGSGGYVATLPRVVYAFRMRAAHAYEVQVLLDSTSGPTGQITIKAWERDADGAGSEISPVTSDTEIADCRKWTP